MQESKPQLKKKISNAYEIMSKWRNKIINYLKNNYLLQMQTSSNENTMDQKELYETNRNFLSKKNIAQDVGPNNIEKT